MKSIAAIFGGFFFNLFLEGFSRVIIAFFHTMEPVFIGVSALPGTKWIVVIYIVSLVSSWFGCMLALTIGGFETKKHMAAYLLLVVLWGTFVLLSSLRMVPLWYLISFPIMSVLGTILAGFTYRWNTKFAAKARHQQIH